jgi:alcohol dehydrogenase (NADP+)
MVSTYGGRHRNGGKAMGGYARAHRAPGHFVVRIPAALPSARAAPMLCGGVTAYSPLRHYGAQSAGGEGAAAAPGQMLRGKKVGIVGVGGIGHFGLLFARAMGAETVVGISRRGDKRADVLAMGADAYIATAEDKGWKREWRRSLDFMLSTVSSSEVRPYAGG